MVNRDRIQIELLSLETGERLLRLTDPVSGLTLEQKLDSGQAVSRQKERLFSVFDAALARAELSAA
jgi:hypothetical protein